MLAAHFRVRSALLAFGCALALGHRCVSVRPPGPEISQVAHFLATAVAEGETRYVDPTSIQWESSRGSIVDVLLGRRVLFLASNGAEEPRDLYRAQVRVGPDGALLEVGDWRNLTQTPLGDEMNLAVHQQTAVFTSRAFGELQGISVLRLNGASDLDHGGLLNRVLLRLRAYQETADWNGIGRLHLTLEERGPLLLNIDSQQLSILAERTGERARVHLESPRVEQTSDVVRSVSQQHYGSDFWLHTLVDVARDAVGPGPLAWLESHVFHWRDWWNRRRVAEVTVGEAPVLSTDSGADDHSVGSSWPPATVSPRLQPALDGEGVWVAAGMGVSDKQPLSPNEDTAPFAKTWLRPDVARPYARLHLIALDMRRLSLGMEAGFEEPKPKTGPPGRGALTGDLGTRERVVATFNGAFKSVHGDYGMMVDGRVLVPPKPRAASVVVRKDGWVGLGTWSDSSDVPGDVRFFRQNLDPLVAGGQVNPVGRQEWGLRLAGGSVVTERSALCRTAAGQIYYAWGNELTGESLASGLAHAGCSYAVHLDMNPGHAGLVFTRIRGVTPDGVQGQVAVPEMTIHPREHAVWSDKDFFYVIEADSRRTLGDKAEDVAWAPSPGPQPPPEVWPALWEGTVQLGGLPVQLLRVEPGRARYAVTASSLEPKVLGQAAPRRELSPHDGQGVVAALSFGHATSSTRYGLVFGGRVTLPLQSGYGNLIIRERGEVDVASANQGADVEGKDVVVQLPELVSGGTITAHASLRGGRRVRGGVCVMDGRLWIATVDHDSSDPVAVTLRNLGCSTVLELDRGSQHAVQIQRQELSHSEAPEHQTGYLWVLGMPMRPRTFEF